MSNIERKQTNSRLSRIVVHNHTVYVAGTTADKRPSDAEEQTAEILQKIDGYLATVGTDKTRLLSAQVWIADMQEDFAGMNRAWERWVPQGMAPTRATCAVGLGAPDTRVEILITAAV
ncbi:endoribonuclease L-PSP [Caballeronia sordidicola]|uniref:Endoribonuclease L-PSP n=1 Tax=Caballeronia sordidicola TaxID=196367 RepID=A0A158HPV0_CABSO|nr:RidA family protein [Caballeronia sordidicola]SAL46097.1 endoribonuclease L-PSP [Caballeronia sordidicola]